jgi:membrane associated rhomboid family serine protease
MVNYRIPRKKSFFFDNLSVNSRLIIINLICFIIFGVLIFIDLKFLDYIAIKPYNIFHGRYVWTFLTSMFMHGGFFHLFANMFSLFFIGSLIEKILGAKRYIGFYLISGIIAGLFFVLSSLVFPSNFNTYAVGASGALFGLIGILMIITPNLPVYIMLIPYPIKMKYAAPGILVVLWLISLAGNVPIGNTAHFGGLMAGLVYGVYLRKNYKNKIGYISKYFS